MRVHQMIVASLAEQPVQGPAEGGPLSTVMHAQGRLLAVLMPAHALVPAICRAGAHPILSTGFGAFANAAKPSSFPAAARISSLTGSVTPLLVTLSLRWCAVEARATMDSGSWAWSKVCLTCSISTVSSSARSCGQGGLHTGPCGSGALMHGTASSGRPSTVAGSPLKAHGP